MTSVTSIPSPPDKYRQYLISSVAHFSTYKSAHNSSLNPFLVNLLSLLLRDITLYDKKKKKIGFLFITSARRLQTSETVSRLNNLHALWQYGPPGFIHFSFHSLLVLLSFLSTSSVALWLRFLCVRLTFKAKLDWFRLFNVRSFSSYLYICYPENEHLKYLTYLKKEKKKEKKRNVAVSDTRLWSETSRALTVIRLL